MTFIKKWQDAAAAKNSILCAGLDPAEFGQRAKTSLPEGINKFDWCMGFVQAVAPHSAAVKINRNYIKDFSREQTTMLVSEIKALGMVAIDDSKLCDIGATNDSGFYQAAKEGFDAVTYAPYPGNITEGVKQAHDWGLGIIVLSLMSNPEFEGIKGATVNGLPFYQYVTKEALQAGADAFVIGAPSERNHLSQDEIEFMSTQMQDELVLMPGLGAQAGDAASVVNLFQGKVMANVGRSIMYSDDPTAEAGRYQEMLNGLLANRLAA